MKWNLIAGHYTRWELLSGLKSAGEDALRELDEIDAHLGEELNDRVDTFLKDSKDEFQQLWGHREAAIADMESLSGEVQEQFRKLEDMAANPEEK